MDLSNATAALSEWINQNATYEGKLWLDDKLESLIQEPSAKGIYMTYSLVPAKIGPDSTVGIAEKEETELGAYLRQHDASLHQIARIYLLRKVLEEAGAFYTDKVAKLIEVADKGELETLLRYLILLPDAQAYKATAVEALRTNIATVFDAIALNNPYPAAHFNDQQWNQMYLKAAFMERDLTQIIGVDARANADLSRIISDYAHERWAASREIDPHFWRPVAPFLDKTLLEDMKRLLASDAPKENAAGALCCYHSNKEEALALIADYPVFEIQIKAGTLSWDKLE